MNKHAIKRFLYWIRERHGIHLARLAGKPKPWSSDPIFQNTFFTNPFRENDKTTVWFRENIREPLAANPVDSFFSTIAFRWFNKIATAEVMMGDGLRKRDCLFTSWDARAAYRTIKRGCPVPFTGAYIINGMYAFNNWGVTEKLDGVVRYIDHIHAMRKPLVKEFVANNTLQYAVERLSELPGLAGFMAYEVVTDLRHTSVLNKASDIHTWTNIGPGARRGLNRLHGRPLKDKSVKQAHLLVELLDLMQLAVADFRAKPLAYRKRIEPRDIEHSLCEWDKYEGQRNQDRQAKRRFPGLP